MINMVNQDSSFFRIDSPDIKIDVDEADVMSFTYEEEMGRYNSGSISLLDNNHVYSKILRQGARLNISFGYLTNLISEEDLIAKNTNPREVFGPNYREGIVAYIQSPNGGGGSDGVTTFNCNFFGGEFLPGKKYRVHVGMTKGDLVNLLLSEIGCVNNIVNFTRQTEILTEDTQVMQRETTYRLLLRCAREWRAVFRISYDPSGKLTAIFMSPQFLNNPGIPSLMSGAIGGDTVLLDYKGSINNVIEYKWQNRAGEGGQGDNVRIVPGADGRPIFLRYVTKGETVKVYKLNEERIRNKLRSAKNIGERTNLISDWIKQTDFEKVKWAFDSIDQSTAPQGLGYTMQVKMMGNPLLSAPLKMLFTDTFPTWFLPKSMDTHIVNYYARKVTHSIGGDGYKIDLDIMDAFTMFGGSLL